MRHPLAAALPIIAAAGCSRAQSTSSTQGPAGWGAVRAASSAIAAGSPLWLDTMPDDTRYLLLHAREDVGSMRAVGDEIEVVIQWPSQPGTLADFRHEHPEVPVPDGTYTWEIRRVQCRPEGPFDYDVEERLRGPDGRDLYRYPMDPSAERARAQVHWDADEQQPFAAGILPYHDDPASFACAALAAKCRGDSLRWPPPPDRTTLEDSQRGRDARLAYGVPFIPRCKR